jgi:radical SAM enzyme (TIGR01210 family)
MVERERTPGGDLEWALTIFLAGRECPFTCVYCDLWRYTLDEATPPGSLPFQIGRAVAATGPGPTAVKLYNASNFFDPMAVPDDDIEEIALQVERFESVTVESHPLFVGDRCRRLCERLEGRLEVAMGLESANPDVLARLNKRMSLDDFDRAADALRSMGAGVRAFVLVGVPFLPAGEQVDWAVRSVEYAASRGVGRVALIPVRGGNGELERLAAGGSWQAPSLEMLEAAFERSIVTSGVVVAADTWDLGDFSVCRECREERIERIERANLSGEIEPRGSCSACGWG